MSAKDYFAKPLLPGASGGYKSPSPGVPVIGTTQTSGNRWSLAMSGSLTIMAGLTPRCWCPAVGSSSTITTVPRTSLTSDPRPSLPRAPIGRLCRHCYRSMLRHLLQASCETILQSPAPQIPSPHGVSPRNAAARRAAGVRFPGAPPPRRTCCDSSPRSLPRLTARRSRATEHPESRPAPFPDSNRWRKTARKPGAGDLRDGT